MVPRNARTNSPLANGPLVATVLAMTAHEWSQANERYMALSIATVAARVARRDDGPDDAELARLAAEMSPPPSIEQLARFQRGMQDSAGVGELGVQCFNVLAHILWVRL